MVPHSSNSGQYQWLLRDDVLQYDRFEIAYTCTSYIWGTGVCYKLVYMTISVGGHLCSLIDHVMVT